MFLCPVTLGHFGHKDYDERHTRALLPSLLPRGRRIAFERERAAQYCWRRILDGGEREHPWCAYSAPQTRQLLWDAEPARGGRDAVCDDDDLIPTFIPALVALLIHAEELNGSPLTRSQVVAIRDNAHCVMVPLPVKAQSSTTGLA
jgi:hypothetical protein